MSIKHTPDQGDERRALVLAGWRAAIETFTHHGAAGWSSHQEVAIAPASLREAQIQAVASAVDACEERGCKECAGMLRGEIHRLRAWDFKDSRSAPQEASKVEPVADEPVVVISMGTRVPRIVSWKKLSPGTHPLYLRPSPQALSDAKDAAYGLDGGKP